MNRQRITASLALTALLLGTVASPALADKPADRGNAHGPKISEKFQDMGDFQWGLNDVIKLYAKGVFKGRGESLFAPGAKITLQEAAVATVRLMDKEQDALALSQTEVTSLLSQVPDRDKLSPWAMQSVAMLVKAGVVDGTKPFNPEQDATRLDAAVMLVKAMGMQAEAQAKINVQLDFKDASQIPADMVGYVAVAVDHKIITGYDDSTFRPHQAVKRVEMAVMMGRADRLIDKDKKDEYKGVVKSVDAAAGTFVIKVGDKEITLTMAADASIFIDNVEKTLANLSAGMKVNVKLNADGKVIYVEARTEAAPVDSTVTGQVTALLAATPVSLALVTINNVAYPVSPKAVLSLNGSAAAFGDLRVGDTVKATMQYGIVTKLEIQRAATTVNGTIVAVNAANGTAPASLTVLVTANGASTATVYNLAAGATLKINGQAALLADLQPNDAVIVTAASGVAEKVEVTRTATTVAGTVAALTPASATSLPKISVAVTANGSTTATQYAVPASAVVKLNGQASQFSALQVGDSVTMTLAGNFVLKVEATRGPQTTVISGLLLAAVATQPGTNVPTGTVGTVSIGYVQNGAFQTVTYTVTTTTQIKLNSQAAQFSSLHVNDNVKATLLGTQLVSLEATR
jgi:hypothetical protein